MPNPSQARILSAIERVAGQGEVVTNRSVLQELKSTHGKAASFSSIGPLVAAWHNAHPADRRDGRLAEPTRAGGQRFRSVGALITALIDKRITDRIGEQQSEDVRSMNLEALRREVNEMMLLLRTVVGALARHGDALRDIDARLREALSERAVDNRADVSRASYQGTLKKLRTGRSNGNGNGNGNGQTRRTRSVFALPSTTRTSTETAAARALGRSVVEAVFSVLVSHGEQMPDHPAMTADEIIAALPASLRSQIAAGIGRAPDRRFMTRLLQPRIDRERYARRDIDGCYIAVPDWRERKRRARLASTPV